MNTYKVRYVYDMLVEASNDFDASDIADEKLSEGMADGTITVLDFVQMDPEVASLVDEEV